jgi:hypothetical protein
VLSSLLEDLPEDAFPGENSGAVLARSGTGSSTIFARPLSLQGLGADDRACYFRVMKKSVGAEQLRQNVGVYPRRLTHGDLDRLIAEGRVSRPLRSDLPEPLKLRGDPRALSRALDDIRGDR